MTSLGHQLAEEVSKLAEKVSTGYAQNNAGANIQVMVCTGIYFRHGASLKKESIGLTPFAQADCYLFVSQMLEGPLLLHMSFRTNS